MMKILTLKELSQFKRHVSIDQRGFIKIDVGGAFMMTEFRIWGHDAIPKCNAPMNRHCEGFDAEFRVLLGSFMKTEFDVKIFPGVSPIHHNVFEMVFNDNHFTTIDEKKFEKLIDSYAVIRSSKNEHICIAETYKIGYEDFTEIFTNQPVVMSVHKTHKLDGEERFLMPPMKFPDFEFRKRTPLSIDAIWDITEEVWPLVEREWGIDK